VQEQFFLRELPSQRKNGRYRYRNSGLRGNRGDVVLFQYAGRIIASATLDRVERFERPDGAYQGALYFDVQSIRVFDPIGPDVVRGIWPKVKKFSQAKWKLDLKGFPALVRRLTGVEAPEF
jgi:hypothetical protein